MADIGRRVDGGQSVMADDLAQTNASGHYVRMASVTATLRAVLVQCGESRYAVSTGITESTLWRFVRGKPLRGENIDRLCTYLGLMLTMKLINSQKGRWFVDDKTSDVIPIDALFGETVAEPNPANDPRPMLQAADVILGHDWMSGREFLIFGRDVLASVTKSGVSKQLSTLRVGLDQETDELEKLIALVWNIKGRIDYQSG
jgi:hypothetical protein